MASKSDTTEHAHLITGFLQGNWGCYEKLVLKYFDRAYAHTIRFTKSPEVAERIVEQACEKLWQDRTNLSNDIDFYRCLKRAIGEFILHYVQEIAGSKKLRDDLWKKIGRSTAHQEYLLELNQDHIRFLLNQYRRKTLRYKLTIEPS